MRARGHLRTPLLVLVVAALALLATADARAQAWLPPQGEGWISLGYGNTYATKHYFGVIDPGEIDGGHMRGESIGLQLGYGVTDHFTLSIGIPFVINQYLCAPEAERNEYNCSRHPDPRVPFDPDHYRGIDDGQYHGTFQDFRVNVAYQLVSGEVSVAPFATAVIPSHPYVYFAHSAPGKDLRQYLLGFSAGSNLERVLPGSYFQVTYDYAFVEPVFGINLDRSDFGVEIGYFLSFLTPSLGVRFLGAGFYTHGGLAFHGPLDLNPGSELFLHHDQIGKQRSVNLGGGFSYLLTGSTEVYVTYLRSVYGRDVIKMDQGLSFGVSWNFSPQQIIRQYFSPRTESAGAQTR